VRRRFPSEVDHWQGHCRRILLFIEPITYAIEHFDGTIRPLDRRESSLLVCTRSSLALMDGCCHERLPREKAEECLHAAEKMRNPAERIEMLSVARAYTSLANYVSHTHRADGSQDIVTVSALSDSRDQTNARHSGPGLCALRSHSRGRVQNLSSPCPDCNTSTNIVLTATFWPRERLIGVASFLPRAVYSAI
jgi:hypothetical protein